jgi:hypothetical protein
MVTDLRYCRSGDEHQTNEDAFGDQSRSICCFFYHHLYALHYDVADFVDSVKGF